MSASAWMKTVVVAVIAGAACGRIDVALAASCGAPRSPGDGSLFEHPKTAKKITVGLVQGFEPCNAPDTSTEGGVPACTPETFNEAAGSPPTGWQWAPTKSRGRVTLKAVCPGAADVALELVLAGVVDGMGEPANGTGTFALAVEATIDDPTNGFMSTVSFPISIPFTLSDGAVKLRTTASAMLSNGGLPPFPNASSVDLSVLPDVSLFDGGILEVRDVNGTIFARPGISLPRRPGAASCDVTHPATSNGAGFDLVQSYVFCDPIYADTVTEGGTLACASPLTDREQNGSPSGGWQWNVPFVSTAATGTLRFQQRDAAACQANGTPLEAACPGGLNPADDSSDVLVTLKLRRVRDDVGLASGPGTVAMVLRVTMHDRANGPLTILDFPMSLPIVLANGTASVKSSLDAVLNGFMHPGLPLCATIELLSLVVLDETGSQFGRPGLWLP